ncbi:hypothetical protein KR093_011611, partial [Drosophila rubida]
LLLSCQRCVAQDITLNSTNAQPSDSEEAHRLKSLLDAARPSTTVQPISIPTSTQPKPKEQPDYSFQKERLPLLSDDDYNNLTDDANPLYFLKQTPEEPKPQPVPESKPDTVPVAVPVAGSPIYITIPIYINTAGKLPLRLTIGDQEVGLQQRLNPGNRRASTKVPNSHFNRLLEIEPPKRRTTNRHRSPSRSKIQALNEHNTTLLPKK